MRLFVVATPAFSRRALLPLAGLAAVLLIVAPVLGASPFPKPPKADKAPELTKTLTGTVASAEDAKGRATFTMLVDGVTWELSAGPKWFWGANNPLAAHVGKTVEVTGTYRAGENELHVTTVDGKALRAPGRPPWAGGPKVVGSAHPGWKDGHPGKGHGRENAPGLGHGRENAPGQNKDKSKATSED
jgi:hypothetical protein